MANWGDGGIMFPIFFFIVFLISPTLVPGTEVVTTPLWPGRCLAEDHEFQALQLWEEACPPKTEFYLARGRNTRVTTNNGQVDGCLWRIKCAKLRNSD